MSMIDFSKTSGQSTIEYAVTIAVFVAAVLAMSGIFKAHIQGNLRQNTDAFSDEQYEAGLTTSNYNLTISDASIQIKEGDAQYSKTYDGEIGAYVWKR